MVYDESNHAIRRILKGDLGFQDFIYGQKEGQSMQMTLAQGMMRRTMIAQHNHHRVSREEIVDGYVREEQGLHGGVIS